MLNYFSAYIFYFFLCIVCITDTDTQNNAKNKKKINYKLNIFKRNNINVKYDLSKKM